MEGHISPVSSASDDDDDEELAAILQEEIKYDEVDINIHFHCEHCFKLSKCKVYPKAGWSCEVISCPHYCGMRFHACKLLEHDLLCSHVRVPCLNKGYGCPHTMPRHALSRHLPQCPASVVVCGCERNRWLAATRPRETIAPHRGYMKHFSSADLDVCVALHDQTLLNQLAEASPEERNAATSNTNRRYPLLPLRSPLAGGGSRRLGGRVCSSRNKRSPSLATDEEDLVPGLSGSVCAKLMGRKDATEILLLEDGLPASGEGRGQSREEKPRMDDYYMHQCSHGVHRNMCRMCKHDKPPPKVQLKTVWREDWAADTSDVGCVTWTKQERVAKVLRRGPLDSVVLCRVEDSDDEGIAAATGTPASDSRCLSAISTGLTPADLRLELTFENYSRHQTKPRNMVTVQCLQVLRRDEYAAHYHNVHCDVLGEGLEGAMLVRRCPLHHRGCPYSIIYRTAGSLHLRSEVSFSPVLQAFGLKPRLKFEPPLPPDTRAVSQEPLDAALQSLSFPHTPSFSLVLPIALSSSTDALTSPSLRPSPSPRECSPLPLYPAAPRLTCLPQELLQIILGYLDGFSLSQVALTCDALARACEGLVRERGLVLQYWYRDTTAHTTSIPQPQPDTKAVTNHKPKKGTGTRWKQGNPEHSEGEVLVRACTSTRSCTTSDDVSTLPRRNRLASLLSSFNFLICSSFFSGHCLYTAAAQQVEVVVVVTSLCLPPFGKVTSDGVAVLGTKTNIVLFVA
ncbi:F-box domain [Trinorchestia longiramus]|nr:F-box domain [Trinorchestia longiramus]